MAHKILEDGRTVVDSTTGDKEGDRITLLSAYRDFIKEILDINNDTTYDCADVGLMLDSVINKWNVSVDNQVDEVPRIWIKRPEKQ